MTLKNYEEALEELFKNNELVSAVFSSPKVKAEDLPTKITLKPVEIQKKLAYQFSFYFKEKVIHKNEKEKEALKLVLEFVKETFKQILFFTKTKTIQILVGKKGNITFIEKLSKNKLDVSHNRKKEYLIEEGEKADFLIELGIFSSTYKVLDKKQDKFRQINKFLELVNDVFNQLDPRKKWTLVDFGCGKAYLTFALYYFLNVQKGLNIEILGLDLKKEVIEYCQNLAIKLKYKNLFFQLGDINDLETDKKIDVVLSLHACDIATDAAIEKAVRWKAEAILSVPCCQHELYKQIKNSALTPLLKHGILKERFSAMATDAARGQILEILGYSTQIIEFIDMEHTPKNVMIRALLKKKKEPQEKLIKEYLEYKKALHITPSLEERFKKEIFLEEVK